ncbi:hypothetical protein PV328_011797 [Microctonus aethiopoides]|uniref:Major facilitator superfamily (MFS) profile domain-containing protein n=1 Tax=Microctonus aethiopoides TaxID=144406 RepID=A0AA39FHE0_9HYME|nr:hypothetical protein PV328_011797 [Microctonus aethiopoides]
MYKRVQGLNARLMFAIIAGALGSAFQHGYNTGVLNTPQSLLSQWINETITKRTGVPTSEGSITTLWAITVAIFAAGGMIGGASVGTIADRYGRKGGLLLINVLVVIAVIFEGFSKMAQSYEMLIIGRLFIGINSGLNAGLAPMYLAEIAPVHLRGAVGTVYQLIITISILIAQILSAENLLTTKNLWPLLLSLTIIPGIFQCFTLPLCPESPKYLLVSKGRDADAKKALSWLRNTNDVHDEMEEMRQEYESSKIVPRVSMKDLVINPALRIPLIISVVVMIAQQFSGINAVMTFSTGIFTTAGMGKIGAGYATMGVGAMNVVMTIVSLVLVERCGRKTLLLFGFGGMAIDTALLTICLTYAENSTAAQYFSVILVILFVVFFATGPGSIPWFLVSELFNQSARPVATSIAIAVNWGANFLVLMGYPPLEAALKSNVFIIFVVFQVLFTLFIYRKVPETKNKTIEEISSMFRQQTYQ